MQDNALELRNILAGSPLRRPLYAILFGIVMVVLLGFGAYNLLWPLYRGAPRILQTFSIGAVVAVLASLPAIALVWFLDRREHESPWLLAGAALWGAVVSASLSSALGTTIYTYFYYFAKSFGGTFLGMSADTLTASFAVPIVEELIKGGAVLILFWLLRNDFDDLRDGMLYGAMVGLGFNAAQYTVNLVEGFVSSGFPPIFALLALQFVFAGINGHFIYSALLGAGFGFARQTHNPRWKILAPIAGVLLAILANILWNTVGASVLNQIATALSGTRWSLGNTRGYIVWLGTAAGTIVSQFWVYILLALAVLRSEKWEVETIRQQLFSEVGVSVTPDEYVKIENDKPFKGRTVSGFPPKIAAAIVRAQDELAYRKWHIEKEDGNIEEDEMVRAWRQRIAHLRMIGSAPE